MMDLPQHPREKILLETRSPEWIVLSIGNCGIFTRAIVGRHAKKHREGQGIALEFAYQIVRAVGFTSAQKRISTAQLLVDSADALIDDPEHILLLCTTWQYLPEGVEICSVGSNSVLVVEETNVREVVRPHTVLEDVRSQGGALTPKQKEKLWNQVTRSLGSKTKAWSCHVDEVEVALVPWLPRATIAILKHRLIADVLLEHPIPGSELFSFLESWNFRRGKTSVLISWGDGEKAVNNR